MLSLDELKAKYPGAQAWSIGDSPEMANELAALVVNGIKTASCGSLRAFQQEVSPPRPGSFNIILNGDGKPVCVIRLLVQRLIRFSEVSEELARKEGEGDLSLQYWRKEHEAFFSREGHFSWDMELIAEEFAVCEVL